MFSRTWIYKWMKEYRVSLRAINKRFCLPFDERVVRIKDIFETVLRARHYFWVHYNYDIPIINGDQMPLHRYIKYGKINVIIDTKDCKDTDHVDKIVVEHKITTHISLTLADEPGILKKGFGANFGVDISSS